MISSIDDFFSQYASTMNNALFGDMPDVSAITRSFSDFVVGASPQGIMGGRNDETFGKSIRDGIDFYKRIGIISMNIISKDVTVLDEFHAMVKVYWKSFYGNERLSGEIPFEVVYLVQALGQSPKIFAFVTGDEQAALKSHHLIPG